MDDVYDINIIPSILNKFKVNQIIISGVSDEKLFNTLLNYSNNHNTEITAIDFERKMNDNDIIDYPLNALSKMKDYDAIFLNDDANWFTVYNELNIIKKNNNNFPLVFICNNVYPHKFRDSYINPDMLPKEYVYEYSDEFPFNYNGTKLMIKDGLFHSIHENTPKNGVSIAINDFLRENNGIGILDVHFINGIIILYPKNTISQIRINLLKEELENQDSVEISIPDKLIQNKLLSEYYNNHDFQNNNELIEVLKNELTQKENIIDSYENEIKLYDIEMNYKNSQIDFFNSKLSLKDSQIENIESKLENSRREIDSINKKLVNSNQILENNENIINLMKHQHTYQLSKLDNKEYCISCYKEELKNNSAEIKYLKNISLIKSILNPVTYLILLFKSKPKELALNFKLYKALKDSKCFDIGYYLNNNPDIQDSKWCKYVSPELHYICNGFNEQRKFNKKYFNRNSKEELLNYIKSCE